MCWNNKPAGWLRRSRAGVCAALLLTFAGAMGARAQHNGDFGLTYTQERSKFSNSACGCFYMRGATADLSYGLWKGWGPAVSATGVAATNLRGSIDIHQIALLGGLRYTYNKGRIDPVADSRRYGLFVEGKIGYTFATSGLFPAGNTLDDHASALTYQGGGGVNFTVYHRFDLRLLEVDAVRTQLPNGGNNQQNTLRLATGINFHLGR